MVNNMVLEPLGRPDKNNGSFLLLCLDWIYPLLEEKEPKKGPSNIHPRQNILKTTALLPAAVSSHQIKVANRTVPFAVIKTFANSIVFCRGMVETQNTIRYRHF